MRQITAEDLMAICPNLDEGQAAIIAPSLNPAMEWADITTAERQAAFLSQLAHESQGLEKLEENLNYSAQALLRTWSSHFSAEEAQDYARQPERIANRAYANRMGNGEEESGDGWMFRGRGPIQLTGRDNYRAAGHDLNLDLENNPDQVATWQVGAYVAAWFWNDHGLNRYADSGDFVTLTRRINGGLNGLAERQAYWERAKEALGA